MTGGPSLRRREMLFGLAGVGMAGGAAGREDSRLSLQSGQQQLGISIRTDEPSVGAVTQIDISAADEYAESVEQWSVVLGDGQAQQSETLEQLGTETDNGVPGMTTVTLSHVYNAATRYTVRVVATEADGSRSEAQDTFRVVLRGRLAYTELWAPDIMNSYPEEWLVHEESWSPDIMNSYPEETLVHEENWGPDIMNAYPEETLVHEESWAEGVIDDSKEFQLVHEDGWEANPEEVLEITGLETPPQITSDETVTIEVELRNLSDEVETSELVVSGDEQTLLAESTELDMGETATRTIDWELDNQVGPLPIEATFGPETATSEIEISDQSTLSITDPDGVRDGFKRSYEFGVTGGIEPTDSVNDNDSVSGNTAVGQVDGGTDEYMFTGELDFLGSMGAVVAIDGEPVDPGGAAQKHTIIIDETTDTRTDYEFTVGGNAEKGAYAGGYSDSASGTTVSGGAKGYQDSYRYNGAITDWSSSGDGDLTVYIDGEEVDTATLTG